ncbi:MAG: hypothetical protein M3O34_04850 [Chloroflexota bacterium]|nr:hypothetical protein [Chloroflexota bacterium]
MTFPRVARRAALLRLGGAVAGVGLGLALQACQVPRLPMPPIGPVSRPTDPTPRPRVRRSLGGTWDTRFGAVEAYRARAQADEIGIAWSRLVFQWNEVERAGPGRWNAHYFRDDILEDELESGRQIVGVLIGTAAWAGDGRPQTPPGGLDRSPDDAENAWAGFVGRMAERYRGRIDHWTIWNEPDVFEASSPAHTWHGSEEQFARLQKVAYLAIKRVNPAARVGLPGLTYWWDRAHDRPQYLERLLEIFARDPEARANNWYFDAATLHLYNEPEGLYRAPTRFREILAARGLARPVWVNETNVTPFDDPARPMPRTDFRVRLDEQASFVVQAFAWGLAADVERIGIYPFIDGQVAADHEPLGLIRADTSPRPAYAAYRVASRHLRGCRPGDVERGPASTLIRLERDDGQVTVAWANGPSPATARLTARASQALLVDQQGQETLVSPEGDAYRLELPPAGSDVGPSDPGRYVVGGPPRLLVERV